MNVYGVTMITTVLSFRPSVYFRQLSRKKPFTAVLTVITNVMPAVQLKSHLSFRCFRVKRAW